MKKPKFDREKYIEIRDLLKQNNINTVCIEANCPNRYECFSNGTATFLILGDKCTRECTYCNIQKSKPVTEKTQLIYKKTKQGKVKSKPVYRNDIQVYKKQLQNYKKTQLVYKNSKPEKIAEVVKKLRINYVVITSVTRDDLEDGGASVFAECVKEIKNINQKIKIELLVPDFNDNWDALKVITDLDIDVLNHNIETVKRLFNIYKPNADYKRSIELLKKAKLQNPYLTTKSGLILGLDEKKQEIVNTMNDLRNAGVDFLSLGQYLAPSKDHAPIKKQYSQEEFDALKAIALNFGFKHVEAGPLVRSSYHADDYTK
ncbi:MAG: Lipoyl synthase [Candidatus Woesearchaeota archaeon]|nr:Lipoyl synthase [Candidatus Woesearchaeota archaeon]